MKKIIIYLTLICIISFIVAQTNYYTYYKLNLDYNKGDINVSSLDIEFSKNKIENDFGSYTAEIIGYNNELLNLTFFGIPNKILWDGINSETGETDKGGELELDKISFEIFIPYYENAKEIIVYDKNLSEVVSKDVSEYSKQKPPGVIGINETKNETKGEKEKEKIPETKNLTEKLVDHWKVFLVILIALVILLIYLLRKKNNFN